MKKINGLNFRFNKRTLHNLLINIFKLDANYKRAIDVGDNFVFTLSNIECFWTRDKNRYKYTSQKYSMLRPIIRMEIDIYAKKGHGSVLADIINANKIIRRSLGRSINTDHVAACLPLYLDLYFLKDKTNDFSEFKVLNINENIMQYYINAYNKNDIEAWLFEINTYNKVLDPEGLDFYNNYYNKLKSLHEAGFSPSSIPQLIYLNFHKEVCYFLTNVLSIFQKLQFINSVTSLK